MVTEEEMTELVGGNTAFAFDLYRRLAENDGNLFYSPYSISLALAMTFAGAQGDTERQMAETLQFRLHQDRMHPVFNALDLSLTSQPENSATELNIANAVWAQQNHDFLASFLDTLTRNYSGGLKRTDFLGMPDLASRSINDWVSEETNDGIDDLISPDAITPLTRLVLTNAIYLKAVWQSTFDERATTDRDFHLLDGSVRPVPMMRQQSKLLYTAGDGYQAAELPYEDGRLAMTIFLPENGRFDEFEESLSGESVGNILDGLNARLVNLMMPKFELESEFSLSDTLSTMGMPDAFDNGAANFSGMVGQKCEEVGDICLLISAVRHKALISVDEAGTEAAAATAAIVGITRGEIEDEPIELVVDRPFLFVIRDKTPDTILFIGRVLDP